MHLRHRLSALSGIALLGLLAAAFAACAGSQGVGERCDRARAGDSDCQSGLTCVEASTLGQNGDVCCESDPTVRTGICAGKGSTTTDAGGDTAVTDTGAADTGTADTGSDTGVDGGADTSDAGADTSSDAGDAGDAADANTADASEAG